MKNKLTLNSLFIIIAITLVLAFAACKKDGSANNNITGTWTTTFPGSKDVINQYQFNADGSFEFDAYKIDTITKKPIGYESRTVGKYKLNPSTTLLFTDVQYYVNPTYDFGPVTALALKSGPATTTQTVAVNGTKGELSFYFDCPINANCVPSPIVYHRQ